MEQFFSYLTEEQLTEWFQSYRSFGPAAAVLLPFIEAFLPFLPLVAFVVANTNSFGLWEGFFLSWLGSAAGSVLMFYTVRRFGQKRAFGFIRRHQSVTKMMLWVERHGFGPLFILLCFPFTPSAAVHVVAGLSRVGALQFMTAAAMGKLVMIFMISFIGYDLHALITQPVRMVIAIAVIAALWYAGKRIERRLHTRVSQHEKDGGRQES
ncbi:TVP38/TMEM64 family protein [Bacillus nakamurai]|uniref:TVP38/TMEM64 family protein n=1 Tax=Bacillus nakamurai TaxID=1793963 RepID=UPI001E294278|nr:TVP38/TMEM64 family protein [Bacillus nakamurai]MCC9021336.1 TVP38/TMEM64 family protein [Bacillus nakamurai]MCP6684179.1 TVP38/TMEM64 family protein [Bacillus nakamurai]